MQNKLSLNSEMIKNFSCKENSDFTSDLSCCYCWLCLQVVFTPGPSQWLSVAERLMHSLQSFHAEDVLWALPLTSVIVVCNYLHFPHRWSLTATASKQSSTILSSLKTVMLRTDLLPTLFVSIRKKKSLMTANIKCVLLKLLPYNMWNGEYWLLLWCLNKINVWY